MWEALGICLRSVVEQAPGRWPGFRGEGGRTVDYIMSNETSVPSDVSVVNTIVSPPTSAAGGTS